MPELEHSIQTIRYDLRHDIASHTIKRQAVFNAVVHQAFAVTSIMESVNMLPVTKRTLQLRVSETHAWLHFSDLAFPDDRYRACKHPESHNLAFVQWLSLTEQAD